MRRKRWRWPKVAAQLNARGVRLRGRQRPWTGRAARVFYWTHGEDPRESKTLPLTWGACPIERPCPHVSCRHHLALDLKSMWHTKERKSMRHTLYFIRAGIEDGDLSELDESCSLDFEGKPLSLEQLATIFGTTDAVICREISAVRAKIKRDFPGLYRGLCVSGTAGDDTPALHDDEPISSRLTTDFEFNFRNHLLRKGTKGR